MKGVIEKRYKNLLTPHHDSYQIFSQTKCLVFNETQMNNASRMLIKCVGTQKIFIPFYFGNAEQNQFTTANLFTRYWCVKFFAEQKR